jgi:hypothetical protein
MARLTTALHATRDYATGRAKRREFRPLYEERHPLAESIAAEIRPLIGLRTRRLVADICEVKGVSVLTAMRAVTMARVARK